MNRRLLLGLGRHLLPVPRPVWQGQIARNARDGQARLSFMTPDHHRVRDLAVMELPRAGAPLSPEWIAQRLDLTVERVNVILDELEKHMTFVFRNEQRAVTWAYPVTVERTPHRVTFGTGEQVYAAWAVDAIATPFVQGQLLNKPVTFAIETECAHCGQPIHIEMDSALHYSVQEQDAAPLIVAPLVNFEQTQDPSIIDVFWRKSVFFWSEEHARDYRRKTEGVRGTYWTLSQAVYITPKTQGALFAFPRSKV